MKLLDFRGRDFPLNQPMEAIRMPKSYQNKEILFVAYFSFGQERGTKLSRTKSSFIFQSLELPW